MTHLLIIIFKVTLYVGRFGLVMKFLFVMVIVLNANSVLAEPIGSLAGCSGIASSELRKACKSCLTDPAHPNSTFTVYDPPAPGGVHATCMYKSGLVVSYGNTGLIINKVGK